MENLSSERVKGRSWRLFIGLSFLAALSLFFHFRNDTSYTPELGTISPRYVTSQIDFDFPDDEATGLLKQEAAKDIGSIYATCVQDVKKRCAEVGLKLRDEKVWREHFPEIPYEKLAQSIDYIEAALVQARHTDARTYYRAQTLFADQSPLYISFPVKEGRLPENFWKKIQESLKSKTGLEGRASDYLLSFFANSEWKLEEDDLAERNYRESAERAIGPKLTKVSAGSHLIRTGERVTPRHVAMFEAMTASMKKMNEPWYPLSFIGSFLFSSLFTFSTVLFLYRRHPKVYQSLQQLSLLASIVLITLIFFKTGEHYLFGSGKPFADLIRYPLVVPFASILIAIFMGWEVSLFVSLCLTAALALTTSGDQIKVFIFNAFASFIALLCCFRLHKRREVFVICGKIFICTMPMLLAFHLWDHTLFNPGLLVDLTATFGFLFSTAALAVGFLTVVESLFPVVTDMALIEYMDPQHPLLRRLSVEAPGTYQHSLVVGNLAESAARAIGANGLFCRISALYHDVGKLFNPHYFTENQLGGFNMHQLLTPLESTQVIIAHVAEGERLARKHRLPPPFIDVIREHHGTQLVYYFYSKQKDLDGEEKVSTDQKKFRYQGPKPQTKESAILMIADTVEAASRCLEEVSEESITALVEKLVETKIRDGQLERCELSFEELERVKKSMIQSLIVANHLRIKYPPKP
ncbi:MAG: HDIG domain-containing protein [Chlamydiales bacterium]|nr:HDIG domain-containing protein [Chlamydiales bacterium]